MQLLLWALLLFVQNFAFTFVSRARNSASIKRNIVASLLSNNIWYIAQLLTLSTNMDILKGDKGLLVAAGYALIYMVSTTAGSVVSHWWALRTEKGLSRVGAYEEKQSK